MWPAKKPLQSGFGNPFGIWKDHRNLDKKKSVKKTSKLASPLQNEQPIKSGSNVQKEKNKNNIDYKKKNTFYYDDFNNR